MRNASIASQFHLQIQCSLSKNKYWISSRTINNQNPNYLFSGTLSDQLFFKSYILRLPIFLKDKKVKTNIFENISDFQNNYDNHFFPLDQTFYLAANYSAPLSNLCVSSPVLGYYSIQTFCFVTLSLFLFVMFFRLIYMAQHSQHFQNDLSFFTKDGALLTFVDYRFVMRLPPDQRNQYYIQNIFDNIMLAIIIPNKEYLSRSKPVSVIPGGKLTFKDKNISHDVEMILNFEKISNAVELTVPFLVDNEKCSTSTILNKRLDQFHYHSLHHEFFFNLLVSFITYGFSEDNLEFCIQTLVDHFDLVGIDIFTPHSSKKTSDLKINLHDLGTQDINSNRLYSIRGKALKRFNPNLTEEELKNIYLHETMSWFSIIQQRLHLFQSTISNYKSFRHYATHTTNGISEYYIVYTTLKSDFTIRNSETLTYDLMGFFITFQLIRKSTDYSNHNTELKIIRKLLRPVLGSIMDPDFNILSCYYEKEKIPEGFSSENMHEIQYIVKKLLGQTGLLGDIVFFENDWFAFRCICEYDDVYEQLITHFCLHQTTGFSSLNDEQRKILHNAHSITKLFRAGFCSFNTNKVNGSLLKYIGQTQYSIPLSSILFSSYIRSFKKRHVLKIKGKSIRCSCSNDFKLDKYDFRDNFVNDNEGDEHNYVFCLNLVSDKCMFLIPQPCYADLVLSQRKKTDFVVIPGADHLFAFGVIEPTTLIILKALSGPTFNQVLVQNPSISSIMKLVLPADRKMVQNAFLEVLDGRKSSTEIEFSENSPSISSNKKDDDSKIKRWVLKLVETTSGVFLFSLKNVTDYNALKLGIDHLNQKVDISLLYSNVLLWAFTESESTELVYSHRPASHSLFTINWSTVDYNVVSEDQNAFRAAITAALDSEDSDQANHYENTFSNNEIQQSQIIRSTDNISNNEQNTEENAEQIDQNNKQNETQNNHHFIVPKQLKNNGFLNMEVTMIFEKTHWYVMRGGKIPNKRELMGIQIDITDLRFLTKQAKLQTKKAQDAISSKSRFLANMSHEIRTPLNGMSGLLEILSDTSFSSQSKDYFTVIKGSFIQLLELLNDILDMAKIEQMKMSPSFSIFSPLEFLHVLEQSSDIAILKGIPITLLYKNEMPPIAFSEPYFLSRILTNILSTSIKFISVKSITLSLDIVLHQNSDQLSKYFTKLPEKFTSSLPENQLNAPGNSSNSSNQIIDDDKEAMKLSPDWIILKITSIGVYLPNSDIDSLFQPFSRVSSEILNGSGASLPLAKLLIDMIEGYIEITSTSPAINDKVSSTDNQNDNNNHMKEEPETSITVLLPFKKISSNYIPISFTKAHYQMLVIDQCINLDACSTFSSKYGMDVITNTSQINPHKLKIIVCPYQIKEEENTNSNVNNTEKIMAEMYKKQYPEAVIIQIALRASLTDNTQNIMTETRFWTTIHSILLQRIWLHTEKKPEPEEVIPPDFKILVADDNEMNRFVVGKLLAKLKVKAEIVSNGQEVLDALNIDGAKYNAVFLDQQMPVMDGIQAAQAIRASDKWYQDIPLCALTANTMKEDMDECLNAGMNSFVPKPITGQKLKAAILEAAHNPFNHC